MSEEANRHVPVLLNEVLDAFAGLAGAGGTIVDGTLGGGGHTRALLEKLPRARVLACDQDPAAVAAARKSLAPYVEKGRLGFFEGNFSRLVEADASVAEGFGPPWSGLLLDLGYSSNQLEDAAYGMSFQVDGPLDMRLSRKGQSAWELLEEVSDQELGDILKAYGEIIGAHRLAQRIKAAIADREVKDSTLSLAGFLERISPRDRGGIHPATLVFQALRIAVNDELRVLDHFLEGVILKMGGSARLAVITFHSLEDRLVKRWGQKNAGKVRALTKKPITAGEHEVDANPRSRSAKLRVYEKN
ncbi:MAG: 16S rRNA (cytosine(1402)-N(4))-methyltransferase RsmH [Deltaproteobacteria bacterium]|nr:16S rRNA (cytosine(1402)-N(4))-methyltransferase RsmH [Deltaproteobacteria bacterium]